MQENTKVTSIAFVLISVTLDIIFATNKNGEISQVEVRAVFINCEPDERENVSIDNEATRFEREELFKHSVLQDCNKKIALTVKITSEPNQNTGDEYIPIEHVFRGQNKRVRLLDPYVLRLRRETPLQAYKLHRIATVSGVLSHTNDNNVQESKDMEQESLSRSKRSVNPEDLFMGKHQNAQKCDNITNNNIYPNNRNKRHEYNIVVEDAINEKYPRWNNKDHFIQDHDKNESHNALYGSSRNTPSDKIETMHTNLEDTSINSNERDRLDSWSSYQNRKEVLRTGKTAANNVKSKADWLNTKKRGINSLHSNKISSRNDKNVSPEEEYDMFEIGNPNLLYMVQVQLFEKLTNADGKPIWNDMTKGESASVSTLSPEWIGEDMNIRYRPTEWNSREEFTLPLTSLCLLTPISNKHLKLSDAENVRVRDKFIVVPKEDILGLEHEDGNVQKRDGNSSDVQYSTEKNEQWRPRVMIRTSRAIFSSKEDKLNIALSGDEEFLTLPLHRPHHAQIDLEARADENQLVAIGSSGRIMTVVADSSRRTRTTLTVQATNTGLAAARFRVVARDCGPEWMGSPNDNIVGETFSDGLTLLPPRHTRSIRLDVPTEIPADLAHCIVSLVNDADEPVAVREVSIKKGDRCFCVWHCECVCLSEDPKLLCREMTEARQMAAGLNVRERVRRARSVCYHDVVSINMLVTAFGVLITLLFFGLVKAFLGLICRCIGSWGLHRLVQMPRKLDHYYESSLRDCSVIYDGEGWPVHPYTKERTVRLVSKPMEFILNVIFFVTTPCAIIYDILKEIYHRCKNSEESFSWQPNEKDKKCYSSHDIQASGKKTRLVRRRRRGIKKWMTPEAEHLSHNIWQGVVPGNKTVGHMRPLLREEFCRRGKKPVVRHSCDSEGEDTEYVLMQMKKSMESLARSQRQLNSSEK